ncbi:hypothetical protein FRC12_007327 [Ceratobasidium sp. 428]|nr:hypothetical protein FRC12_007327 [Ceratobasidium sp. 428]
MVEQQHFVPQARRISYTRPLRGSSFIANVIPTVSQRENSQQPTRTLQLARLTKPEKNKLLAALGLLLVSSSITMSFPLAFGKLIDFFAYGTTPASA